MPPEKIMLGAHHVDVVGANRITKTLDTDFICNDDDVVGTANYNDIGKAYESTSGKFGRMRQLVATKGKVDSEDNSFTDDEIASMS